MKGRGGVRERKGRRKHGSDTAMGRFDGHKDLERLVRGGFPGGELND